MNKRIFDHLRDRLHAKAGLGPPVSIEHLYNTEWSTEFETRMRNRLVMGALRYGPIGNGMKTNYNRVAGIIKRLNQYCATGNLECLVDVANLCLLEYVEGTHPTKHFAAKDGDHSCT